jgi:mgtE-like transporter
MDSRDIKESTLALSLVTVGNLITGFVLGYSSPLLSLLPALFLLIPPSIGLRGNIYASLGSRLNSYLHTGRISPKFEITKEYSENLVSSTFLLLLFSMTSGFMAAMMAYFMGLTTFGGEEISLVMLSFDMITISALSGILSATLMIPSTLVISLGSYSYGWNPDNLTAPFITLIGDVVTLPILFLSAKVIFGIPVGVRIFIFLSLLFFTAVLGFITYYGQMSMEKHRIARRIIRESSWVLLACVILDVFAGSVIGIRAEELIIIAGLLTVIPSFLEDGGAIGGILSSRFSSLLHLGVLKPNIKPPLEILKVFGVFHLIGLFIFALIGVLAQTLNIFIGLQTISTLELVLITIVAGQILLVPLNLMSYYFSILSFRKGLDPDNIGIPLITSIMDVLGTLCFIGTLIVFGVI